MKTLWIRNATGAAAFALLLVFAVGCSSDSPVAPNSSAMNAGPSADNGDLKASPINHEGSVEVIVPEKNMFMLAYSHLEVYVQDETRAVVQPDGRTSILDLEAKFLSVGDYVKVSGYYNADGLYMAERVEIWRDKQPNVDRAMQ